MHNASRSWLSAGAIIQVKIYALQLLAQVFDTVVFTVVVTVVATARPLQMVRARWTAAKTDAGKKLNVCF